MIRGKILFLSLCVVSALALLLGLVEMWTFFMEWEIFLKVLGTILVLGTQLSFLVATDYDLSRRQRKWPLLGWVGLSVLSSLFVTLQIWVQPIEWSLFLKLLGCLGVIVVITGFILAVAEDFRAHKSLKDNSHTD